MLKHNLSTKSRLCYGQLSVYSFDSKDDNLDKGLYVRKKTLHHQIFSVLKDFILKDRLLTTSYLHYL